jgi:4-hydroxybenzoate polyprenyltransferase
MLSLSDRIYPLLQLTRAALVFTAISNSFAELLLRARFSATRSAIDTGGLDPLHFASIVLVSAGLYGFGMTLNDIIDRRRDEQLAADRPLPSGRIGLATAHMIAAACALVALAGGTWYAAMVAEGWKSLALVIWTAVLITFYDAVGKYLVWPGLVTLGLIRLFHAVAPAPQMPLIWHPLLLFNHVTILSTIAYYWEEKRPALTRAHLWAVIGWVGTVNAAIVSLAIWRRTPRFGGVREALWIEPGLIAPAAAVVVFVASGWVIWRLSSAPRQAGRTLMLVGLLWLIVYDAAFVAGYVGLLAGLLVMLLMPLAYLSVRLMRGWGRLLSLSQRPTFRRVE